MKWSMLNKFAISNLSKNSRLYIPSIIAGSGLLAVFYVLLTLATDPNMKNIRGGDYLHPFMILGVVMMCFLSMVLIFYTNSFLMKQRKREYGLYNVLGLEKKHVIKIVFVENFIATIITIALGILLGAVMYKGCSLAVLRLLDTEVILGMKSITFKSMIFPAVYFAFLYFATYIFNCIQVMLLKPVEMLKSVQVGEKEPKIKWPLLVIGSICMACGYYISITTDSPIEAFFSFFGAVFLVIIGTYCLFVTGITAILKLLKKNEKFYYQKGNMVAVSGLIYRMKQNAVGLASITIMATIVLIMCSATISMYVGIKGTIERLNPHYMSTSVIYETNDGSWEPVEADTIGQCIRDAAEECGLYITYMENQEYLSCAFMKRGNELSTDQSSMNGSFAIGWFIDTAEYERLTGNKVDLKDDEILLYNSDDNRHMIEKYIKIGDVKYKCVGKMKKFPVSMERYKITDNYGIVMTKSALSKVDEFQRASYMQNASAMTKLLMVDFEDENKIEEKYSEFYKCYSNHVDIKIAELENSNGKWQDDTNSKTGSLEYLYGMYGSLLFLGALLTMVFLFATALIIYYKQISEGYDDRNRFQIMQKVGMSNAEVKGTISKQILLVFFLPLMVAAVHVIAAYPMMTKIIKILLLTDNMLYTICLCGTFLVFALIYIIIYSMTAKVYYQIVH